MPTYGQSITWTNLNGDKQTVSVDGCETAERATREAIEFAVMSGWTPPRWWQFWRWSDTRPRLEESVPPPPAGYRRIYAGLSKPGDLKYCHEHGWEPCEDFGVSVGGFNALATPVDISDRPPCKWCHEGLPHPGPAPGYCFKEEAR